MGVIPTSGASGSDGAADLDDPLLADLNPAQRLAVAHGDGPLLVVAGAGSGKTRVLTNRIAYLIARRGVRPSGILAITFTNKAADEMRRRVEKLVGDTARWMWVSTFHSACVRILRSHADRLGYTRSFTIYDAGDAKRLMTYVMADLDIDTKRLPVRRVLAVVGQAKSEGMDFEAFAEQARRTAGGVVERRIADCYREYQGRLLAANAMDFDDLLLVTVNLLEAFPEVLDAYQSRFEHVLVDEYQDTNKVQNRLVMLISRGHRNVCVVGDSDQSIYRFRGADIANILDFERTYPDTTVVHLEQNYRSTQVILDAANAVIARNVRRKPKDLWTDVAGGADVSLYRAVDGRDEAAWVAGEMWRLRHEESLAWGDIAVFYRTNAQSRALEEELVFQGVPYRVIGGTRFYDRREVRDLLAYLHVALNREDEVALKRVVNVPRRGVGETTIARLGAWAATHGTTFGAALDRAEEAGAAGRALKGIREFVAVRDELAGMLRGDPAPAALLRCVLDATHYEDDLRAEGTIEAAGRLENVAELVSVAEDYRSLEEMLEAVSLVSDTDDFDGDGTRVSLMTLHSAKGLEFPAVFMVGMEDGIFPHGRSLDDPDAIEEERRLCYVGITRARRHLYLTHAWRRAQYGTFQHAIPSRFLGEIPSDLVREVTS